MWSSLYHHHPANQILGMLSIFHSCDWVTIASCRQFSRGTVRSDSSISQSPLAKRKGCFPSRLKNFATGTQTWIPQPLEIRQNGKPLTNSDNRSPFLQSSPPIFNIDWINPWHNRRRSASICADLFQHTKSMTPRSGVFWYWRGRNSPEDVWLTTYVKTEKWPVWQLICKLRWIWKNRSMKKYSTGCSLLPHEKCQILLYISSMELFQDWWMAPYTFGR